MTPERWTEIKALLAAVLERPREERVGFLDQACNNDLTLRAEVESLLTHEQPEDERDSRILSRGLRLQNLVSSGTTEHAPRALIHAHHGRIGPYKIVREIAYGGMGAVYLAERDDDQYRRQVAIKLIRRDMDTEFILQRFRNERQILAALDHPNIARLFDGGTTTDGLPYLVMEYVDGLAISAYCDEQALNTKQRLQLFEKVCDAVEYAHKHQVIHRDIKPNNILVTKDGVPKLLDFGIAKVLASDMAAQTLEPTLTGLHLLTPAYASPEQVKGEPISAASDVYSLGVLLYELLTGHKPYRVKSQLDLPRAVLEEEPTRPSTAISLTEEVRSSDGATSISVTPDSVSKARETSPDKLRRRLRGDLDNILMMALRKDPARRYASVAEFAGDIRRHLEDRPVAARKDSLAYRANKFMRRSRIGTAPLIVLLLILSVLGLFTYRWITRHAKPAADLKLQSIAVLPFKTDPSQAYLGQGIAEAMVSALMNSNQINVRPVRASLLYPSLSQSAADAGRALQVDAVFQGTATRAGDQIKLTAQLVRTKDGAVLWRLDQSEPMLSVQDSLAMQLAQAMNLNLSDGERVLVGKRYTNNVEAYDRYLRARHLFNRRRPKESQQAVALFEQAIQLDPRFAAAYAGIAHTYILVGSGLTLIERMKRAKAAAQKALDIDDQLAEAHMALGRALIFSDWDWAGSEKSFKRAIELSPQFPDAHHWYSHNLTAMGRHEEALTELKQAFDIDPFVPRTVLRQGQALYLARQYDRAIEEFRRTPFQLDAAYFQVYWRLGLVYAQKGMYDDAISMLQKAQTFSEEISLGRASLAYVYAKSGNSAQAMKIVKQVREESKGEEPWMMLAGTYGYLGEKDKAIECLEKLYEIRDSPIMHIKVEPMLDSVRSDTRYQELVRRVGLMP